MFNKTLVLIASVTLLASTGSAFASRDNNGGVTCGWCGKVYESKATASSKDPAKAEAANAAKAKAPVKTEASAMATDARTAR